jgi:hypothetical protein
MIPNAVHHNLLRMLGGVVAGQILFTAIGTHSFVVPAGVTSISAVVIAPGATAQYSDTLDYWISGGGGGLAYSNSVSVTPGETLSITVSATECRINRGGTALLHARAGAVDTIAGGSPGGQGLVGQVRFNGGVGYGESGFLPSGGGAAGYTSNGQSGGYAGIGGWSGAGTSPYGGGAGGAAGAASNVTAATYGGGGGSGTTPGPGCVRIIWGAGRAFPNTNTGDVQ